MIKFGKYKCQEKILGYFFSVHQAVNNDTSQNNEEYENQLSKGRKNDDLEAESDFMVKLIWPFVAVLEHTKNRKKRTQNKNRSVSKL